jgi:hypothetical protein
MKPCAPAALRDPDAAAVTIDIDACRGAPDAAFGHLAPAFDGAIRIGRRIGRSNGLGQAFGRGTNSQNGSGHGRDADQLHLCLPRLFKDVFFEGRLF